MEFYTRPNVQRSRMPPPGQYPGMRVVPALRIVMLLSSATVGCYPEQIVSLSQPVTVTTLVDSQSPLKTATTFALPDTIIHPTRAQGADVIGHEHDAEIL